MQVVTNLQNDVGYTVRGAEAHADRFGQPRATAGGWLGVGSVRVAILFTALLGVAIGVALFLWRGWPVLAIGVASLLAALAYMGGPRPIAYTPLGELTVFAFFGLVAVPGSSWVLGGRVGVPSLMAGAALGTLAAAVLAVNNHRDREHDRRVGRRTLAVILGERASGYFVTALLLTPFAWLLPLAWLARWPTLLLPLLLLPSALRLRRAFARTRQPAELSVVLLQMFGLGGRFAVCLAAGAVSARFG
jgi:1,4-dihydroxy-2-naphthoate polyprenyltransferase